ncbi:helix-turn-helix domain-containing protein [Streptomyces boluensis]|uniref:DUF2690 domain-containing protein n=1 Tax=Streptomyces boluensis TaxID=1775135 RepID=A0A964UWH8_9ACTN|nr:XRE family transcriptional regulator [Streptomyces boluensis]NBE56719.1 DUF2690 domain-containing protein [Streptomyces boluensis]
MPRWRALPDELDPQVREFASQLRRLVDRSGLSIAALADRTGYSKTSWERYLNGRLLAPKGAIVALAEVTGTNPLHLTTMWELAERAWSRSEMRHDMTMEAIRISQARAALGESGTVRADTRTKSGAARGRTAAPAPSAYPDASQAPGGARGGVAASPGPQGPPPGPPLSPLDAVPPRGRKGRKVTLVLVGVVGVLAVLAGALWLTGFGPGGEPEAKPSAPPTSSAPKLPAGVKCAGADCTGKDPEKMGCGGELVTTSTDVTVGTALVEVRYSKSCGAAWARINGAQPGDTVRITGTGTGTGTGSGAGGQSGEVDADGDAYTPMVAVKNEAAAKACATLGTGQQGCTG